MRTIYPTAADAVNDGWIGWRNPVEHYRNWLILGPDSARSVRVTGRSRSGHHPGGMVFDWVYSSRRVPVMGLFLTNVENQAGNLGAISYFMRRVDWDAGVRDVRERIDGFLDGRPNVDLFEDY